ncbi:MAG: EF-hand domain-containing protein, partial [Armatimonadetes bacterium]|nr:EF-hand domain-containing protein [Armatimonadota bacterium]
MRYAAVILATICATLTVLAQQPGGQMTPQQRFKQLDRNGDGKLTPQELPGEWFGRLDTNRDGVVTLEEATAALASIRQAGPAAATAVTPLAQTFAVEDVPLTAPGSGVSDPEYNDEQHLVTYWDYSTPGNVKVYVGALDPRTGLFRKPPGRDHLIAEHVSPFFTDRKWWAHNGPEWGRDQHGWAVYFAKDDAAGVRQVWQATPSPTGYEARQLTTLPGGGCGPVCSQDRADTDTRLLLFAPDREAVCWAASSAPNVLHELPGFKDYVSIAHWVPDRKWVAYIRRVGTPATPQLVYLDTETGVVHQVSDEPGDKYDPWGFQAPQFGGETLMMCVVDRRHIAVYRDTTRDGNPWTRIATLTLPGGSPHQYLYSVEPIAPATGANGDVWFSLNASAEATGRNVGDTGRSAADGSIWVMNLGHEGAPQVARRVDEGALSGIKTVRYESEAMLGESEVFVYYERKSPETGRGEVRRCRTGIALQTASTSPQAGAAWQQDFVPDAPFVGEVNGSYIDPEFSEGANQVVFQDMQNRVWIGDLDPATGLFKTAAGRDVLIDENITLIFDRPPQGRKFSTNGPEWTKDEQGYCVVYTKADAAGLMQQWVGRLVGGKAEVRQLTTQPMDCYGNMPSRFEDGKPPRVAFTYDWPITKAKAAWVFLDRPGELHQVPGFDYRKMSMWSAVSPDFLFVHRPPGAT